MPGRPWRSSPGESNVEPRIAADGRRDHFLTMRERAGRIEYLETSFLT